MATWAALALLLQEADAAVQMPRWFGDGMILQTNAEYGARAFLNGKAAPGETVSITGDAGDYITQADDAGDWIVMLNPGRQGDITVQGEDGAAVAAKGTLSGDVFFCSGQSNMVFPMQATMNAEAEIATLPQYPHFRFFMTGRDYQDEPQWDLAAEPQGCNGKVCNQWVVADADYLKEFSAMCYMTVRDIARMHTGSRPVGLIQSAWGGTRVEAWMSADSIAGSPYADQVPMRKDQNAQSVLYNAMVAPWKHYSVRAVIWNQGEANADQQISGVDQSAYYATMYQAMIADWRDQKGMGDFAWLTQSLPPSVPTGTSRDEQLSTGRMEIRLAQAEAETHPGCLTDVSATAVAIDLGGISAWGVDHAPNKNEMSRRLALQAVHVAYAKQGRLPSLSPRTPSTEGCFLLGVQYDSNKAGNANIESTARSADTPESCQEICASVAGCVCFTHHGGNGRCWLMSSCSTPMRNQAAFTAGAPEGKPCPESNQTDTTWTGPVLEAVERGSGALMLKFQNFSAQGMSLRDVKATNINGSSNDCTLCCAKSPPFEVSLDGTTWELVPEGQTMVNGAVVELRSSVASKAQAVRYACLDYVECVLQNSDGLPAGPFLRTITEEAPSENAAEVSRYSKSSALSAPPLGFNSWNFYHCNIDENLVKAVADAMASNGMKDAGYRYVNIDDCWQVDRLPNGTIQPDPARFPSGMKALADYVHSKGLKFGVYTARKSQTCQTRPGSYEHEAIDAATYCDWGLDYLKIDGCKGSDYPQARTSWDKFHKGFQECHDRTGRWIVQSVESCGSPTDCGSYVADVADLWRTHGDIQATWTSVLTNIHGNAKMAPVAKVGHYNDPDMMQVGNVGLSVTEQYSHMALWAIAAAPILVGTDVVHASEQTLKILTNKEVLAINQDPGYEGKVQGTVVDASQAQAEVWSKRLQDGSYGVLLLNLGSLRANVTATWSTLGKDAADPALVRDLWNHKDLGPFTGSFTAEVESHGTVFVKLSASSVLVV